MCSNIQECFQLIFYFGTVQREKSIWEKYIIYNLLIEVSLEMLIFIRWFMPEILDADENMQRYSYLA